MTRKARLPWFSQVFRVSVVGKYYLQSQILPKFSQVKGAYSAVVGKQPGKNSVAKVV